MKMKMKKVTAAVAMSVGVSALGINAAQADAIMFPVITVSDTVTTILSVVNTQNRDLLHYAYFYKGPGPSVANDLTAECEEINFDRPTSLNDVVSYDVGGVFGSTVNVLFNDPSINADYGTTQSFAALRNVKPARAFGLVDNNRTGGNQGTTATGEDGSLYGEAVILELANGAAWGYRAYNSSATNFNFSNSVELEGEVLWDDDNTEQYAKVHLMPFETASPTGFSTRFFVTPIDSTGDQRDNDLTARVRLEAPGAGDIGVVMFDRDENLVSGQLIPNVTCVGAVGINQLLSQAARLEFPDGGWSSVNIEEGTGDSDDVTNTDQAVVMKLDFNLDGDFEGQGINGVFNSAVWVRTAVENPQ